VPNRIYDNVIAVDSAMGNLSIVGGASSNITQYNIIGISFNAATTLGNCIITAANTLDIIWHASILASATNNGFLNANPFITFASPLRMGDIKCPTLAAGSARVYLA
jgi:hypothetical protein